MSNSDGYDQFSKEKMIAEILLRLTALENCLVKKQIIEDVELQDQLQLLSQRIADIMDIPVEELPDITPPPQHLTSEEIEVDTLLKQFNLFPQKVSKGN